MKPFKFVLLASLFPMLCYAQNSLLNISSGLAKKQYSRTITKEYFFTSDSIGVHTINYVRPLVNYFANHDISPVSDIDSFGEICQMFATVGCYKRSIVDNEMSFRYGGRERQADIKNFSVNYHKNLKISSNPNEYIIGQAAKFKIAMINEAHDNPFNRAYILSLLENLKKAGYGYLAMETLNWDGNLDSLDQSTGYYTAEPVMGELIRYALKLGYKLLPYEAKVTMEMTQIERDSMEAVNLISILKEKKDEKMLVIAGYDHINEVITDTMNFQPMAYFFKKLSGIDPFTIEQVNLTECSADELSRTIYKYLPNSYKQKTTCIKTDDLYYKHYINSKNNQERDVYLIHPRTKYVNGRPIWLTLNGLRKRFTYTIPAKVLNNTILVQAYYAKEVLDESLFDKKVPADQMMFDNKKVDFYLRPHNDYLIICRDINNKIINRYKLHG